MSNTKSKPEANLTAAAHRNHEEMFPNYRSVLKGIDPDLIEIFDNWAFDEVLELSQLETKTRVLMVVSATIGANAIAEYKLMVGAAFNVGASPIEIKEILYQATAYIGMARAFDFVLATNDIFRDRKIEMPLESQSTTTRETRFNKGLSVQKMIFGSAIDKMYEQSPKDLLHIQKFLSAHCFGDFYTRSGLDLKTRELVTLSILIAMGGTESQIKGHIQGNLNAGNARDILIDLMTQLLPWVGYPRTLNAISCLNEIAPPKEESQ